MSSLKKKKSMWSFKAWPVALAATSLSVICVIAFFKWVALDWIVNSMVAQRIQLTPGTDTWDKWIDLPVPIHVKFFFFNVTNPIEVQNGGKPNLVESGPYVFEEKRVKESIAIDDERDTISYKQRIFYYFRPELSNGTLGDRLVIINVPFVTFQKLATELTNFSFALEIADRNMRQRGERLFNYHTVREYLFDGYDVQSYLNFLNNPVIDLLGGTSIPKSISTGKFGFYYARNGSVEGDYIVRTGSSSHSEFGQIVSWNGLTKLKYFYGKCNLINGTDGTIAPPFVTKKSILRFFSSDICRSMYVLFNKEKTYKGVTVYKFTLPDAKGIFDDPYFCFCPAGKNNQCYKQGVMSMAPCQDGAPVSLSYPHFLDAWQGYKDMVTGLNSDKATHETFLEVEPKTGLILRAAKRLQFNVMLMPNKNMPTFANIRPTLFPFLWVEETAEAQDEYLDEIRQELFLPVELAEKSTYWGLLGGLIFIFIGIMGMCCMKCDTIGQQERDRVNEIRNHRKQKIKHQVSASTGIDSVSQISQASSIGRSLTSDMLSTGSFTISRYTMTSENKSTSTDDLIPRPKRTPRKNKVRNKVPPNTPTVSNISQTVVLTPTENQNASTKSDENVIIRPVFQLGE